MLAQSPCPPVLTSGAPSPRPGTPPSTSAWLTASWSSVWSLWVATRRSAQTSAGCCGPDSGRSVLYPALLPVMGSGILYFVVSVFMVMSFQKDASRGLIWKPVETARQTVEVSLLSSVIPLKGLHRGECCACQVTSFFGGHRTHLSVLTNGLILGHVILGCLSYFSCHSKGNCFTA